MTDYIRGKKAYTKWDVDAENVDIDLPTEGHRLRTQPKVISPECFTGPRGRALKGLLVLALLLVGMVIGYLIRRGVHEMLTSHAPHALCGTPYGKKFSQFLQNNVDTSNLLYWLKNLSSEVHSAGSDSNHNIAQMLSSEWTSYGLDTVKIETFNVLLSKPSSTRHNSVNLLDKNGKIYFTGGQVSDKTDANFSSYNAFAPNKTAKGKLIYGNFGRPEDFEYLLAQNLSVNGSVVLLRNGVLHRGNKVQLATKFGAVGVILYSDPEEVVPSDELAVNVGLPGDGVVQGSLKTQVGDVQTVFLPSTNGMWRDPVDSLNLPSIPVQSVGYDDAMTLFRELSGPEAPKTWKGQLNLTYNLASTSDNLVSIEVHNELVHANIYNVLGAIVGDCEPGRYVIIGCHYDAWGYGASDPNSGMAILIELTRLFGLLRKGGWKPGRTLIFAAWDGEEQGMIGSTEWIQAHATELVHHTVAYVNIDAALSGNYTFMALASPILRTVLKEATAEVKCHEHPESSIYDMWRRRRPRDPNSAAQSKPDIPVPGSGSDFTTFLSTYGISSAHIQFVDHSKFGSYPMYHTSYDTFDNLVKNLDPHMHITRSLTRVAGLMLMLLVDNINLPMHAKDYADWLTRNFHSFKKDFSAIFNVHNISLEFVEESVKSFVAACDAFQIEADYIDPNNIMTHRDFFDRLVELDRCFILPPGVPVSQFRHVLYGPDPDNVYNGVTFPLVRKAVLNANQSEREDWEAVRLQLSFVINAIRNAIGLLKSQTFVPHH